MKQLIEKGADVNVEEFIGGMTALTWALRRGEKYFLNCDFQLNFTTREMLKINHVD